MKKSGFIITESIVLALIGLVGVFYGGAITEAETEGKITDSISYTVEQNKTRICKEFYPEIIITDK